MDEHYESNCTELAKELEKKEQGKGGRDLAYNTEANTSTFIDAILTEIIKKKNIKDKNIFLSMEETIKGFEGSKRTDYIIKMKPVGHNKNDKPLMVIEVKRPNKSKIQSHFGQIFQYLRNLSIKYELN